MKVSSAVEALSKAYQASYAPRMTNLLWRHYEKRLKVNINDAVITHPTHGLCIHVDVAKPFCVWFSDRCKKKTSGKKLEKLEEEEVGDDESQGVHLLRRLRFLAG